MFYLCMSVGAGLIKALACMWYNRPLTQLWKEFRPMATNQVSYTGPSWRDAYIALETLEGQFGGGFVVQMCSAGTLGNGSERGLYVTLVWRVIHDGRPVDWRYAGRVWKAQEHGSVPALICDLARDFARRLSREGHARRPPLPTPVEGPPPGHSQEM